MLKRIFWTLLAALIISVPNGHAGLAEFKARTAADVAAGLTTPSRANLDILRAIKAPGRLTGGQALLAASAPGGDRDPDDRCPTMDLVRVRQSLKDMDPADRAEAENLLGMDRPYGVPKTVSAAKSVQHILPYYIVTTNFSIEWGSTLTNEDGSTPLTDANGNGIPDVAELWASYLEHSLAQLKAMGFTDTPGINSYKIQVLIANSDPGTAVDDLQVGYYGVTSGDIPWVPGTPPALMVLSNNFTYIEQMSPNDEASKGLAAGIHGAMMVTAVHELFHVIQFMYSPSFWATGSSLDADSWWLEASSTWSEDEVYPFVNDYKQYFKTSTGWQNYPYITLAVNANRNFGSSSIRTARTYGSVIFPKYLSEHMGGPVNIYNAWYLLKTGKTWSQAMGTMADTATNSSPGTWAVEDLYLGFAGANSTMDYDDGALYGNVTRSLNMPPDYLGSSYSTTVLGTGAHAFTLNPSTPPNVWGITLSRKYETTSEKYNLVLAAKADSLSAVVDSTDSVTTAASYLGPNTSAAYQPVLIDNVSPSVADTTPPSAVSNFSLASAPGGFLAHWNAATDNVGIGGYIVEYKKSSDSMYSARTLPKGITSALIRNLLRSAKRNTPRRL